MREDKAVTSSGFGTLFEATVFKDGQRMIPTMSVDLLRSAESTVDWSMPWVLGSEDVSAFLPDLVTDNLLLKEIDDAFKAFLSSDERRNPSKGKGKIDIIDGSLLASLSSRFYKVVAGADVWPGGEGREAEDTNVALRKLLNTPDLFLTKGGKVLPMVETASLGAIKWYTKGMRQILIVKFSAIASHVRSTLAGPALKLPLSSIGTIQWLGSCTHEKLSQWVESGAPKNSIFKSSLGPGEMLWTPPGWLKFESSTEDSVAVRLPVLPLSTTHAATFASDFRVALADLMTQGRTNQFLEAALKLIQDKIKTSLPAPALEDAPAGVEVQSPLADAPRPADKTTSTGAGDAPAADESTPKANTGAGDAPAADEPPPGGPTDVPPLHDLIVCTPPPQIPVVEIADKGAGCAAQSSQEAPATPLGLE